MARWSLRIVRKKKRRSEIVVHLDMTLPAAVGKPPARNTTFCRNHEGTFPIWTAHYQGFALCPSKRWSKVPVFPQACLSGFALPWVEFGSVPGGWFPRGGTQISAGHTPEENLRASPTLAPVSKCQKPRDAPVFKAPLSCFVCPDWLPHHWSHL